MCLWLPIKLQLDSQCVADAAYIGFACLVGWLVLFWYFNGFNLLFLRHFKRLSFLWHLSCWWCAHTHPSRCGSRCDDINDLKLVKVIVAASIFLLQQSSIFVFGFSGFWNEKATTTTTTKKKENDRKNAINKSICLCFGCTLSALSMCSVHQFIFQLISFIHKWNSFQVP